MPAVTTYCAPCLADLALVREATTAVGGTASCMAHAVLLTHPTDDPHRRRQRLAQLRDSAAEKLETAGPEERLRLEILVEEYGLASAGLAVTPFHVHVPSFGDWGFVLAAPSEDAPALALSPAAPPLRFLDEQVLAAAAVFPRDRQPQVLPPTTLDRPRVVDDLRTGYVGQ